MKPANLSTKRLILRRTHDGDADYLFDYTSDIESSKFLTRLPHTDIEQTKKFLDKWCDHPWDEGGDNFCWVVSLASNDEPIGILITKTEECQAEVHFGIRREFWHKGYASELLKVGTDWLLSHGSLQRIWTVCDLENVASIKVLEKSGFVRESILRDWLKLPAFGDSTRDCYLYSYFKKDS